MAENQEARRLFRIYHLGKPTDRYVTAPNEEAAIATARYFWERIEGWTFRCELAAREIPWPSETEEPSTKTTKKQEKRVCGYALQYCERTQRWCPCQREIRNARNGHEMIELARECPSKGKTMSQDEYSNQIREAVKEAAWKWDHKIWWRA